MCEGNLCPETRVLQPEGPQNHQGCRESECLFKHKLLDSTPTVSDSVDLVQNPNICRILKSSKGTYIASPRSTLGGLLSCGKGHFSRHLLSGLWGMS